MRKRRNRTNMDNRLHAKHKDKLKKKSKQKNHQILKRKREESHLNIKKEKCTDIYSNNERR